MKLKFTFILFLINIISLAGFSQRKSYKNEFGFRTDNDLYLATGQDKYYTNGLFVTFRSAMTKPIVSQKLNKRLWGLEMGHEIYTPQSGYIPNQSYVDRPFAGYVYAGGSLCWFYNTEDVLKITLRLGTIGPLAFAKEMQVFMHQITGLYKPRGWETQINNAIGLNTVIDYQTILGRSSSEDFDLSTVSYANLGTTFTGIGSGLLLRIGTLSPLFNSASTHSRIGPSSQHLHNSEFFVYLKPMLHYCMYDATVQGGLFSNDKGPMIFDIEPFVFSNEIGVTYAKNRWTAKFWIILKSKEVKSFVRPDQYGSISLYYAFN